MAPRTTPSDPRDLNDSATQLVSLVGDGQVVLHVGCGDGSLAKVLADRGCRVSGVEVEPVDTSDAAAALLEKLVIADLDREPLSSLFEPATFDVVLFGDLLADLADPAGVLRDASSLLVQDGRILASVAHAAHGAVRLAFLQGSSAGPAGEHSGGPLRRQFTSHGLCDVLEAAGLAVEELHSTVRDPLDGDVAVDVERLPDLVVEWMRHQPGALDHRFVAVARATVEGRAPTPRPRVQPALPGSDVRIDDIHTQRMREAQDERHRRLVLRDHILGLEASVATANARVVRAAARAKASARRSKRYRDELAALREVIEEVAASRSSRAELRQVVDLARRRHEGEDPSS